MDALTSELKNEKQEKKVLSTIMSQVTDNVNYIFNLSWKNNIPVKWYDWETFDIWKIIKIWWVEYIWIRNKKWDKYNYLNLQTWKFIFEKFLYWCDFYFESTYFDKDHKTSIKWIKTVKNN